MTTKFNTISSLEWGGVKNTARNFSGMKTPGLTPGLHPANERRRYFVTTAPIGWVQAYNQPWNSRAFSTGVSTVWALSILNRADSRFVPSQWETSLQSNTVSHWLGTNLESALLYTVPLCMSTHNIICIPQRNPSGLPWSP